MSGPTSLVFYLDYIMGTTKGNQSSGSTFFDARTGPVNSEFFSNGTVPLLVPTRSSGSANADPFVAVLSPVPIKPGTLSGSFTETSSGTVRSFSDDGNGNVIGTGIASSGTIDYVVGTLSVGATTNDATDTTVTVTYDFDTEASDSISQIDLQLTSAAVTAEVRKLRARWSLEASQNLQALHGMDAEAELVGVLAEVIKFEIDRQIINDLYNFAGAGSVSWDKATPANIGYAEHWDLTLAAA